MVNFRKFKTTENIIEFSDAESYEKQKCDNEVDVNVASTVTLVVGKNNAGKTTIIQALDKLVNHNDRFGVKDFNMDYLKEMAMKYKEGNFEEIPSINFEITIGLDKGKDDYVTNIVPFLTIGGVTATEVTISVKFELTEKETFINAVKVAFSKEKKKLNALYELSNVIEDKISLFKINYYTETWNMGIRKQITQTIANILMFLPLGFIFPVVFKQARTFYKTSVCMLLVSFFIEFIQYFIGRSADIDDLILNTLGGMLGYLIFSKISKLFKNRTIWKKFIGTAS